MVLSKLTEFVNQRPGFDFANYGDAYYYRQDYNYCLKQKRMYESILAACYKVMCREEIENRILQKYSKDVSGGRLVWDTQNQQWEYTTGQYFPTEYRGAAARILWDILWGYLRDTYKEDVKKHAKRITGTRVFKYFY